MGDMQNDPGWQYLRQTEEQVCELEDKLNI
jgi:hypothetical protein